MATDDEAHLEVFPVNRVAPLLCSLFATADTFELRNSVVQCLSRMLDALPWSADNVAKVIPAAIEKVTELFASVPSRVVNLLVNLKSISATLARNV